MTRSGGFLVLLLSGLGIFAVVYLLFGDSMTAGVAGSGFGGRTGESENGGYLTSTGLEAAGARPKSAEEIAAEKAAAEAEQHRARPEEGVFGRVTDGRGEPIAGATVLLFPDPVARRHLQGMPDGDPLATATSEADGTFVVGPSPADGFAKVRAQAAGYAPTVARVTQRGARVDLILDRGGALEIRTLDAEGEAVAGAQVIHTAGTVVTGQTTGEDGIARFDALPTGTGTLLVVKEGYGTVRDQSLAVAPGAKEERTLVLTRGAEVNGTVLDSETERPVEGAEVRVRYPSMPWLEQTAGVTTDEEGRFKLTTWAGGNEQMIVRVTRDGYAEARQYRNAQHKGELTVKLQKAGEAVSGRVVGPDRQPVANVRITFLGLQQEEAGSVPEAVSDTDGNFTIPLPAWGTPGSRWNLLGLSDTQGVGVAGVRVPKPEQGPAQEVELALGGMGSVTGVVRDAGGGPVQGAIVSLAPDYAALRNQPRHERVSWQVLSALSSGQYHNLTGLTGAQGKYEIRDVPALAYKVSATFGLDNFTLPDAVTVKQGEKAEADIALGEGGTIEGVVMDSEEKPVPGAYVSASPQQRNRGYGWWQNRPTARSQSDGKFVLRGISDQQRYDVQAYASGYGNVAEKGVSRGDTGLVLRLKARGWIVGVVQRDGEPYRGTFTVSARPLKGGAESPFANFNNMWVPGQQQRTFNTDDGTFEIKGMNAGEYSVQATTSDGLLAVQPAVVTVVDGRPSTEARLELASGAVVSGVVRDDETGSPLTNIWVYANGKPPEGGGAPPPTGHGQTDRAGHYEIKGLGSGSYTISAYVGSAPVQAEIQISLGEQRQVNLAKRPPGSVRFLVTDKEGTPIARARTQIRTASGNWIGVNVPALQKEGLLGASYNWDDLTRTGEDGTLTRYHVPPGTVTAWASASGYKMAGENPQIQVASGRVTDVHVTLERK